ncbi:hypothetical protein AYO21_07342 [Fonsecaea monophora]|uniref:Uncharacterized protein n=1 Tax=Fonsecaea monophora TaxID=254056 RepID=A0A177F4K7_9EURO|nr:hypothetical protein AYO21_07342 [Fonsecaea monophora]OAG38520.1 hypothetical protein AYO21_07342 [Fonsecaea monophora]
MDGSWQRLARPGLLPGPQSSSSTFSRDPSPYSNVADRSQATLLNNRAESPADLGIRFLSGNEEMAADRPNVPAQPAGGLFTPPVRVLGDLANLWLGTVTLTAVSDVSRRNLAKLEFWPPILKWYSTVFLTVLYLGTAGGIVALWFAAGTNGEYHLSSENVRMISRYFPSALGTLNVILFRHLVREYIRMKPFVAMADQGEIESSGKEPSKSVSGAFFPWQDISITRGLTSVISLLCQLMVGFIVSLKVALFASGPATVENDGEQATAAWTLMLRAWPAFFLIIGHIVMTAYVLWVAHLNRGKSTGLRWDPVTIADYCALFAHCDVTEYFSALELLHNRKAKQVLSANHRFRLGYWTKTIAGSPGADSLVYGIGPTWNAAERPSTKFEPSWGGDDEQRSPCNQGTWPECEHYPYRHSPGCGKGWVVLSVVLVWAGLGVAIYGLINGIVFHGFRLDKDWSIPSSMSVSAGNHTFHLPPIDPTDPESKLIVYALLFRSAPVYVTGVFTATIIEWVDLNMRFMQPFINMFGKAGDAADTVLLAYITTSPLQVPITAIVKGHYKVATFSILNTLSPLFPIFIGGLLQLEDDDEKVRFMFSLSAYIGIMVFLIAWSVAMPFAYPIQKRLLPRQFYSMADLMAMCHRSYFIQRPYLDFADNRRTPSKEIMEARILMYGDRFLFGHYTDDEDRRHIGFDIHSTVDYSTGDVEETGLVVDISPRGEIDTLTSKTVKTMTNLFRNAGKVQNSSKGFVAWLRRTLRRQRRETVQTEMNTFTPRGSATGSHLERQQEPRQRPAVAFAELASPD